MLSLFFVGATYYFDGLHKEGMFGLVAILSFFMWVGTAGIGALVGCIGILLVAPKERKVACYVTLLNILPSVVLYWVRGSL